MSNLGLIQSGVMSMMGWIDHKGPHMPFKGGVHVVLSHERICRIEKPRCMPTICITEMYIYIIIILSTYPNGVKSSLN